MGKLEVSFNSPQCGWMSIGFEHDGGEFHTTTAAEPHRTALSDVLKTVTDVVNAGEPFSRTLQWNRDPEEYDFVFSSEGDELTLEIVEYTTGVRKNGETVFSYTGDSIQVARAFAETFQQMYEEREIDEFEENWHQPFPSTEFEALKAAVSS